MQDVVEFKSNRDQGFSAAAVLLGLVQVTGKLESDGNLCGQSGKALAQSARRGVSGRGSGHDGLPSSSAYR